MPRDTPTSPQRPPQPSPEAFFSHLKWLDGRPLLDTIERYRARIFEEALYTFRDDGTPQYNLVLAGRAKKNWKSTDLILAALYRFLAWESPAGNDGFLLANDEGQSGDDLSLAKKLVAVNPALAHEIEVRAKELVRVDGRGSLRILPAQDAIGAHGKTALFVGYDEIHGYRSWDLFEALAPDPTRPDVLTWVTSYDTVFNSPGAPLHDMKAAARRGDDRRMYYSWYSGDTCTDSDFAILDDAELRANPSIASWPEGREYLEQQRRRLPRHKYRRLHLNLPGLPEGAALAPDAVMDAIVAGRRRLDPEPGRAYVAFVDMSGGSSDDAVLAIAHKDENSDRAVLDFISKQNASPPFNPRVAVQLFTGLLKRYGLSRVIGDAYAGETYRQDFLQHGITYQRAASPKSALYEALDPLLNAGEVELLDVPQLQEQLLGLVWRGQRIDHLAGEHDDFANAAAGALLEAARRPVEIDFRDAWLQPSRVDTDPDSPWADEDSKDYASVFDLVEEEEIMNTRFNHLSIFH